MTDEAPRRDKFASMKAALSNPVPTQDAEVQSVRVDNFASLSARQIPQAASNEVILGNDHSTAKSVSPTCRRDKFANMVARQEVTANETTNVMPPKAGLMLALKRDKLANLAEASSNARLNETAASTFSATVLLNRDKSSSVAQQQKASNLDRMNTTRLCGPERMKELNALLQQRGDVLNDLEKAEGYIWNLIHFASKTSGDLVKLRVDDDTTSTLTELSSQYRDTLQTIHSLLSPHSKFVKAYQNHQEETDVSNMYAARVETRLAQERRNVLDELVRLEKLDAAQVTQLDSERKRKRET
jgi:hypothetical protein